MRDFVDTLPAILPPNATQLERDVLSIVPFEAILDPAVPLVDIEKGDTSGESIEFNETVLPWLDLEYGLLLLSEFLPDNATRIQEGLKFLKSRGTPASLLQGLEWLDFPGAVIREEVVETIHFPEYQIILDRLPFKEELLKIIRLAKIAQPVRATLRRIVYLFDNPRFVLDEDNQWGDVLDNYSGLWFDRISPHGEGVTDMWLSSTPRVIS